MKIPVPEELKVAPTEARAPSLAVPQPQGFDAVRAAGADADQLGNAFLKMKAEAEAKDASDLITEKQKRSTDRWFGGRPEAQDNGADRIFSVDVTANGPQSMTQEQTPGFSATKGESALAGLDDHLKGLDEDTKELAEKAKSKRARDLFLAAAAKLDLQSYEQAKGHVAQQLEVAKTDSLKANLAETLRYAGLAPADDNGVNVRVAETAGAAVGMATSQADAVNKVESIRAEVAQTRVQTILKQDKPDYDKAEAIVKGSEHALGKNAEVLRDAIRDGRAGADAQATAATIAASSRSANIFTPLDLDKVNAELAKVPEDKRKKVTQVMDELIAADARRVKADKDRFVDAATSQYAAAPGKFFGTTTANVLREVDPDKYLQLEDRLRALARLARTEGNERITLQKQLDQMALDDLRDQLDENPMLDTNKFLQQHPEMSGAQVNHVAALASKAKKVYEQGLKPTQDKFVADFLAEADKKMPAFSGTKQDVLAAKRQWRQDRRDEAIDIYTDAVDAADGEKPDKEKLDRAKAAAIVELPLVTTPQGMAADVKAVVSRGNPKAGPQEPPPAVKATGQVITMPNGDVYAIMSDKSTRLLAPAKKKRK